MRQTLLVVAAALAAFGLTAVGSFHFDDYSLFSDPAITSPGGWLELWGPLQTRPLTYLTFWLNHQAAGPRPADFHIVNLALHLGAAVLLLLVLGRLLPARIAFIAALLFAIHPVQTQAVAYVFARGTLLCTLFCLASLWFWLGRRHWLAALWFAAALLAKEECAAFPLFLALLSLRTSDRKMPAVPPLVAMLMLSLAAGLRVIYAASAIHLSGAGSGSGISAFRYLSMQGIAILRYMAMLIVPWGYTVDPDLAAAPVWRAAAWLALIGLTACAVRWWRIGFWFVAGLLLLAPSSSIFPAADLAADRRMYLPMIAFCVCAASLIQGWRRELLAVIFLVFTALSIRYSWVWRSERSLWAEAVELAPNKIRPKLQLARALDPHQALGLIEEAQRIAPDDPAVASEQGRVELELGHPAEALSAFGRALALSPADAHAINNRGAALLALGQEDAAKADFDRALNLDPCLFDALLNLQRLGSLPAPANCRFTPDQIAQLRRR